MQVVFLHIVSPGSYPKSSKSSFYSSYNFLHCSMTSWDMWSSILSVEDLVRQIFRFTLVNSGSILVRFCLMAMYMVSSQKSSRWPMTWLRVDCRKRANLWWEDREDRLFLQVSPTHTQKSHPGIEFLVWLTAPNGFEIWSQYRSGPTRGKDTCFSPSGASSKQKMLQDTLMNVHALVKQCNTVLRPKINRW